MTASYKGQAIFSSGPCRFAVGRRGVVLRPYLAIGVPAPGSEVVVRGRLTGTSESQLWSRRDAVVALLDPGVPPSPDPGTLDDGAGRTWSDMMFWSYEEGETVDRGRVRSVAYTARFRRLIAP